MDLGLDNLEFWRLTPRMLDALLRRRRQITLSELWPYGVLATLIANQWRDKDSKMAEPFDFFPDLRTITEAPQQAQAKTPDELLGVVAALNAALGGKDLRGRRQLQLAR